MAAPPAAVSPRPVEVSPTSSVAASAGFAESEQRWEGLSLEPASDTIDLIFPLSADDVQEFMTSADFEWLGTGPGEDGSVKMFFQTVAAKVPILFEPANTTEILLELLYDQADAQITVTGKSIDDEILTGTLSFAMDLFAG